MKEALGKIIRDKNGKTAIIQAPNTALYVWFASVVLSHVLPYGQLNFAASLTAFGAGFTWAWLELFYGDVLFRRILGGVVLFWLVWSRL